MKVVFRSCCRDFGDWPSLSLASSLRFLFACFCPILLVLLGFYCRRLLAHFARFDGSFWGILYESDCCLDFFRDFGDL
jgi:hypothetical protein